MKVDFLSLFLLLSLGLAGCGSDTPEQNADRGGSTDDGNNSVVLSPPGKPQENVTPATARTSSNSSPTQAKPTPSPEPVATTTPASKPASKPVAAAAPEPEPATAPAAPQESEDTTPKRDIFRSAGSGDLDAVKYHLANGIKVNAQDKT
ncbi:MAG: hypothetical protein QGG00_02775, partial [Verrucomicrobiota bacterium]|nr:hypothetical protein [Verrucomicrobiota bacterium]